MTYRIIFEHAIKFAKRTLYTNNISSDQYSVYWKIKHNIRHHKFEDECTFTSILSNQLANSMLEIRDIYNNRYELTHTMKY